MASQSQTPTVPIVTNNQTGSHLNSIPLEVLLQITSRLPTPDYCNLRITCKYVEAQLHNAFTREFFTKRQFMISEFSLQTLLDISNSRFASTLTCIIIGLEKPSPVNPNQFMNDDQLNYSAAAYSDYLALIHSGRDCEMLSEAFMNLKNLEAVGLRDFASRTRYRDFPNIEWRSYGVNTFFQQSGQPLVGSAFVQPEDGSGLARIFLVLLRSLGISQVRPKRLEIILRNNGLNDLSFYLPPYVLPTVQPVIQNLTTLFLDLATSFHSPQPTNAQIDPGSNSKLMVYLQEFLARATNLEHLRLNFPGRGNWGITLHHHQLAWLFQLPAVTPSPLIQPASSRKSTPTINLSNLRQLDLGMAITNYETILDIVRKFRSSLRTLSLHKITLVSLSNDEARRKVNRWGNFYTELSAVPVNLTAINLSSISQSFGRKGDRRYASFKDSTRGSVRNWAGNNMQSALRDFIQQTKINWSPWDSEVSSGSDSEEEDFDNGFEDIDDDEDDDGDQGDGDDHD